MWHTGDEHEAFGGKGPNLIFLHANGIPPLSYRALLAALSSRYRVFAPPLVRSEGAIQAASVKRWSELGLSITPMLAQLAPVVLVGHSMGAVIAADLASRYPQYVARSVLLDPPVLPRSLLLMLSLMPLSFRSRGVMAKKASTRREAWPDQAAAFLDLRARGAFVRVPDDMLWDYVRAGTRVSMEGGAELVFPKTWEIHLHSIPPDTWGCLGKELRQVRVVRGAHSHVLSRAAFAKWSRRRPADDLIELDEVGHLLPLERPDQVAALI